MAEGQEAWIGLTGPSCKCDVRDAEVCDTCRVQWAWPSGEGTDTYSDWLPSEPASTAVCAKFTTTGWKGQACTDMLPGICERSTLNFLYIYFVIFNVYVNCPSRKEMYM